MTAKCFETLLKELEAVHCAIGSSWPESSI